MRMNENSKITNVKLTKEGKIELELTVTKVEKHTIDPKDLIRMVEPPMIANEEKLVEKEIKPMNKDGIYTKREIIADQLKRNPLGISRGEYPAVWQYLSEASEERNPTMVKVVSKTSTPKEISEYIKENYGR